MHQNGTSHAAAFVPGLRDESGDDPRGPLNLHAMFEGSRILVLGGTGFLGKIFWILLLHRFPELGKIFLLVRASKKQSSVERFWSEVATSEAMLPLKEKYGEKFDDFLREKVVPIDGDVSRAKCGIADDFIANEKGTIDAVVNVAGVVDFNPPLDEALDTNAFGAQNLVELARALGDAPLFHTSTCYVVGNRQGPILEDMPGREFPFPRAGELDPALWNPEKEISDCLDLIAQARHRCEDGFRQSVFKETAEKNLLRRSEPTEGKALDQELAVVKRKFVSDRLVEAGLERAEHWGWPNIYTYTKSIGEQIIARSGIPFVIARPACCESTQHFPFSGWNEGIGTSAPLIFMGMKGQHQMMGRNVLLDFIPSDQVCLGMILALSELLERTNKPVYQFGCSDTSPITMERLIELTGIFKRKHYLRKSKGNPFVNFLQAHMEPTAVSKERFDLVGPRQMSRAAKFLASALRGAPGPAAKFAKPAASALEKFSATSAKIDEIQMLFAPFTYYQKGPFSCANTRAAFSRLSPEDRALVPWAPEKVDWADYFMNDHLPAMEKRIIPWLEDRWKRETKPLRAHETLASLTDQMAERHAHSLAFQELTEGGLTRITYSDVLARANAVARRLIANGVKKGDRVVLAGMSAPEWPIAYLGCMRAGAIVVPIDRDLESVQFANIVTEAEAHIALWDAHTEQKGGAGVRAMLPELRVLSLKETAEPDGIDADVEVAIEPDDVASLIFTSGTTGTPKGVMLTHKNFTSLIASLAPLFPLGPNDRVLSVLPLHHTFEFSCGFLLPFSRGARVVYIGELTGDRVKQGLQEGRITAMVGVPAVWQLLERRILSDVRSRGKFAESAFHFSGDVNSWLQKNIGVDVGRVLFGQVHDNLGGHIKWLISGGAALPKDTQKLFTGLGLKLAEGYGLTEAGPVLTVAKPGSKAGQVGKAIPGVELKIDSPDPNGIGEVLARGANVMTGYYGDEEATKAALTDDGFLRTGDLGKFDKDGRLSIVGRSKDVIVTATGENIYPDDLEKLVGNVKHIAEYAFVGVDAHGGGERLVCLATPEADASVDRATRMARAERHLREALNRLPAGKQPGVVKLYDAPLPRTATKKVKRGDARAIVMRLIAASTRTDGVSENMVTHVRYAIAGVRGIPVDSIQTDATLIGDLGFDSLALTELLAALETKYGTIDPNELLACVTVADVETLARNDKRESRTRTIEGRNKPRETREPVYELPREIQDAGKKAIGKVQDFFYGQMMDSEVYGRTFIPHNRQTIVIANHASHLDMGFVRHALGRYGEDIVTLAAQDYFFDRSSVRRTFFENLTNLKALDRRGGLRASERQASEVLSQGKTMLIFPEGTRSADGDVHEFKPLLGHLALANGVDILPVYLGGTRDAMPKGAKLPTSRRIFARVGPPLCIEDLRRLTKGLSPADASREVAKLARRAVIALRDGDVLDVSKMTALLPPSVPPPQLKKREHPLVELFQELETKFDKARVDKPVSFYFTLGSDTYAKWTVLCDREKCDIRRGKPEGGTADCVLKTTPEIFTRIVRDSYVPGPAEFISGAVKSNDIELLFTFQKIFALSS